MITFNSVWVVATISFVLAGSGCGGKSVSERLASDIREVREAAVQAKGPSWLATMANQHLLSALTSVDPKNLHTPHLAAAIFGVRSNDAMFAVLWIEDSPSVKGIELIGDGDTRHLLAIPDVYKLQNAEDAKRSVVFRVVYRWALSDVPIVLTNRCGARLITDGATASISPVVRHLVEVNLK